WGCAMFDAMRLSIIIPVLDEGERIASVLDAFADMRERGAELVVVDGGSRDATIQRARLRSDIVLSAPRGLASQFNAGAAKATGEVVLFLRGTMRLPPRADILVLEGLERSRRNWGYFKVWLNGRNFLLPLASELINVQSWITGLAGEEQAIFAKRSVFLNAGGFPSLPEMEHMALCKALKRAARRPLRLRGRVV